MVPRRPASVVALTAVLAACAALPSSRVRTAPERATPVGLVTEGSAFVARPGLEERIVRAIESTTHRPVVRLDASPDRADGRLRRVAVRLGRQTRTCARYDWREPRCAADRIALTAADARVAAVYRVELAYVESERPATGAEVSALPLARRALVFAAGLVHPTRSLDRTLSGRVTLVSFGATRDPAPVAVAQRLVTIGPRSLSPALDADAAVRDAIRALPVREEAQWSAFAGRLVASGCPLLGLAVDEAWLGRTPGERRVRAAAIAAVTRSTTVGRKTPPVAAPAPAEERYSCSFLCGMHMIELCNRDKVLWDYYRTKWQETPCGTARPEPFLAECYRQQWVNGTYDTSCMAPCEATLEGRERLIRILGEAGCLRS